MGVRDQRAKVLERLRARLDRLERLVEPDDRQQPAEAQGQREQARQQAEPQRSTATAS